MAAFAASGPGRLAIIDGTMKSGLYQQILQENFKAFVCELKLNRKWIMQQDYSNTQVNLQQNG